MKRNWTLKRQLVEQQNGQRRWDSAYQLLMQWTVAPSQGQAPFQAEVVSQLNSSESPNEHSHLCSRLDPTAKPEPID